MPLLTRPHLVAKVTISVQYCAGSHADDDGTTHEDIGYEGIWAIVPPADYHVDLDWPPRNEAGELVSTEVFALALFMKVASVVDDVPGATLRVPDG